MDRMIPNVTAAEREFYGRHLVLLEGVILEFLSCMGMIRRYRCSQGYSDPIAMDCWANLEHQLKYKQEIANQTLIVQELKRCADEITSTDLSLQTIRELIESAEKERFPCVS